MSDRVSIDVGLVPSIVRYALGRRSYIVSWTIQEVQRLWPKLPEKVRAVIVRDVADDIALTERVDRKVGMDSDDRAWRAFLAWMENATKGDDT